MLPSGDGCSRPAAPGPLRVVHGPPPRGPVRHGRGIQPPARSQPVLQLAEGEGQVGLGVPGGGHMPQRQRDLERVHIGDVTARGGVGAVMGRDPRHVAAQHQDHVGLSEHRMLFRLVPVVAHLQRMFGREVHPHRHRLQHADPGQFAQPGQPAHRGRIAAEVGGDDQRRPGVLQRGGDLVGHLIRQCGRGHRIPPRTLAVLPEQPLLPYQQLTEFRVSDLAAERVPADRRALQRDEGGGDPVPPLGEPVSLGHVIGTQNLSHGHLCIQVARLMTACERMYVTRTIPDGHSGRGFPARPAG